MSGLSAALLCSKCQCHPANCPIHTYTHMWRSPEHLAVVSCAAHDVIITVAVQIWKTTQQGAGRAGRPGVSRVWRSEDFLVRGQKRQEHRPDTQLKHSSSPATTTQSAKSSTESTLSVCISKCGGYTRQWATGRAHNSAARARMVPRGGPSALWRRRRPPGMAVVGNDGRSGMGSATTSPQPVPSRLQGSGLNQLAGVPWGRAAAVAVQVIGPS